MNRTVKAIEPDNKAPKNEPKNEESTTIFRMLSKKSDFISKPVKNSREILDRVINNKLAIMTFFTKCETSSLRILLPLPSASV